MEVASKAGFDGLELNLNESKSEFASKEATVSKTDLYDVLVLSMESPTEEIQLIKEMAEQYKIDIPSVSTDLFWKYPLTSNDTNVRTKAMEIVKKMIDSAKILGADTVLVVPGLVDEEVSYKTAYDRSLECFLELRKYAEEKEIHIGVENVWNKFLMSPLEMRSFIDKINSPFVGTYFDVGNVLNFSYPEYWIEILSDTIRKVHVKDFKTSIGNITGFTSLLEGDVNWIKVIEAFRKVGYDGYLTAELTPYRLFPEELIISTSKALDKIIHS